MYYRTVKKLGIPKKNRPLTGRCKMWLRGLNIGRVRDILDLLSLGKNIEKILQRIQTEDVSSQQNPGNNSQNDNKATNLLN
jgi:hypothetical protein